LTIIRGKTGKGGMTKGLLILLLGAPLVWVVYVYNRLVFYRNEVKNAWKQIDVQLKRRHDLIPNLVSVVKGYMEFERETLEKVTLARARAVSAARFGERFAAENSLTRTLHGLFGVMENYPALKSNENVLQLQDELVSTENKISFSRQHYNDLVANYCTFAEIFPNSIVAGLFSFRRAEFFTGDDEEKISPAASLRDR
jgi:LemA protein